MELQDHKPDTTCVEQVPSISEEKEAGAPATLSDGEDPFGDESDAQVKYKTLAWW